MNQVMRPAQAATTRAFAQLLSSTRRGARLARLLTVTELHSWGVLPDLAECAELVVGELAANAVLHGRVNGRDFRLALALDPAAGRLTIELTDACGEHHPHLPPAAAETGALRTGGRGLLLVDALADHWETVPHPPSGKTVRAVLLAGRAG
ncbi:ATP-binding protein [Streptomyces sp. NBC_01497]|uniref:ATP-binding protein n=1 Tax=Streptomyces sp. NBC_01497 TaxID=2903885 RepID=UPI002E374463|nr:ATP-binding protein [Streptomyces sp. NBC_01497]